MTETTTEKPGISAAIIVHDGRVLMVRRRVSEGDKAAKDKLTEAMVMGTPVVALCGKVWVPSRAPEKFPVCPECKDIWESMKTGGGSGSDGSGPEA